MFLPPLDQGTNRVQVLNCLVRLQEHHIVEAEVIELKALLATSGGNAG
jgi:hypothetical protein